MKRFFVIPFFCALFLNICAAKDTEVLKIFVDQKRLEHFDKKFEKLPSDAKILKEVEITYETNDGRIEKRVVHINELIDHNDPILIAKNSTLEIASLLYSPIFDASLHTKPAMSYSQTEDKIEVKKQEDVRVDKIEKQDLPKVVKKSEDRPKVANATLYKDWNDFVVIGLSGGNLKIITTDTLKAKTNLTKEKKIVLDFVKENIGLPTRTYKIDHSGFGEVTLGSHPTFYSVAVRVDKDNQAYEVKDIEGGYMIILR